MKNKQVCLQCGADIIGKRIDAKWCSNACGQKFRWSKHYRANPEYYRQKRLKDNSDDQKRMYSRVKSRAKKAGIPFDMAPSDIVIPDVCPVLGIPLVRNNGRGYHYNSPSLDRVDPGGGYVTGNVRVISARANLLKNDATVEELELVLEDLRKCVQ